MAPSQNNKSLKPNAPSMKRLTVGLLLLTSPLAHSQEGTQFPSNRLTSEESGYNRLFGSDILTITTASYRSYRYWMSSKSFSDLGDPAQAEQAAAAAMTEARAARAVAARMIPKLEYYTPPDRFRNVHNALYVFAKDSMRPIEERAPSCKDVYNAANELKMQLIESPVIWTPSATPPAPLDVTFIPMGLPIRYSLTKGTFSLGQAIATPLGTVAFSLPLTSTPGVNREEAKIVAFEFEGRGRAFALDRTINIIPEHGKTFHFNSLGFNPTTGIITVVISTGSPNGSGPALRSLPVSSRGSTSPALRYSESAAPRAIEVDE